MLKKILITGVLSLMSVIVFFMFQKKDLYHNYTYDITPQKEFLQKVLSEKYGNKYKLYTAYFNPDEEIPDIGKYNPNAILWLGRKKFNIKSLSKIKKFGIVLTSDFDKRFVIEHFFAKNAAQFPEFMPKDISFETKRNIFALLGNPLYAEKYLKKHKLPYKKYTYADIKKLEDDLPQIKGIIIEQNQDDNVFNMEPTLLTALKNNIPLIEQKDMLFSSPQSLVGHLVLYYFNQSEFNDIIEKDLQTTNTKEWLEKYFIPSAVEKRLQNILENKEQALGEEINLNIVTPAGYHPMGDEWLAKDLIGQMPEDFFLTYKDTSFYPRTKIALYLVGKLKENEKNLISETNILWLAFPHVPFNKSEKPLAFEEYMQEFIKFSTPFNNIVVSSHKIQKYLQEKGIFATYIPQFTNTDKFYPDYDESKKSDVLFVGNSNPNRKAVYIAKKHNLPITIYGSWWPKGWAKAPYVDNRILRKYYSSAKIVLNDQNKYMTDFGTIINRIMDATACKTLVISEYAEAVEEMYGDCVPMWKTEEEFVKLTTYYLSHEEERRQKAECAYEITLKHFTAAAAAKEFEKIITEIRQEN